MHSLIPQVVSGEKSSKRGRNWTTPEMLVLACAGNEASLRGVTDESTLEARVQTYFRSRMEVIVQAGLWKGSGLPSPEEAVLERVQAGGLWKKWNGSSGLKPEIINNILPAVMEAAPNGIPSGLQKEDVLSKIKHAYFLRWSKGRKRQVPTFPALLCCIAEPSIHL